MQEITGAEALMLALIDEGVDVLFGYPGGAIMPAYDALYDYQDKIKHVLVRHEQGAGHAAQGYARVTGKTGACIVTSGPGATNLVTPIADAMMDSVPMVCLTGQVFSSLLGSDAFQETDIIGVTIPITKWNYQITKADEVSEIISKAFYIANSGRPGPVLIDITKDAQIGKCKYIPKKVTSLPSYKVPTKPANNLIREAAELINQAERPFILAGHGVLIARAQKELVELSERSSIPVGATLHGLSCFPTGHKNYVGMLGMHGNYGPNLLSNNADLIIAIGMRFDDRVTGDVKRYLRDAKIIHIDIDPAEIDKIMKIDVPLIGDARETLQDLNKLIEKRDHSKWISEFSKCYETEKQKVIDQELVITDDKPRMAKTIMMLSEKTKGKAVVVADVGQHQMMAARYYRFAETDSWVTSGGLGTMGFALPAAMGCKFGAPKREVVAVIGDGCFQMTIQELATIAQENLPVKALILNNNYLGMVRQWQELFFEKRYSFVELKNPDFVAISKGFGCQSKRVTKDSELSAALDEMLNAKGPYVLEVVVEKENNVFPMVPAGASVSEVRLD